MAVSQSDPAVPHDRFNFSRAGNVAPDQLRSLRLVDEQFSRNVTHALAAWLRTHLTVTPLAAEQMTFGQFTDEYGDSGFMVPLSMEPTHVQALMSLHLKLAPPIVNLLLGGTGDAGGIDRELTEIEEAVLESVLDLILREWNSAWQAIGIDYYPEPRERDGQQQRLMPASERTLCCRFEIALPDINGNLVFCIPAAPLNTTLRALAQRRERSRQRTPAERRAISARLHSAGVHTTLAFPSMRVAAAQLGNLQPGELLQLPLRRDVKAELRAGGALLFEAQPVRSGELRAARLQEPRRTIGNITAGVLDEQ